MSAVKRKREEPAPRRPRRDREADRTLFEEAIARLDPSALEQRRRDADRLEAAERPPRFDKRVARGEVEPATRLDLHGCDRDEAAARLRRFLAAAEVEVVLIVHGRGAGILRATAIEVLDRHPRVVEHRVAPRNLGGEGARLARLRRRVSDRR